MLNLCPAEPVLHAKSYTLALNISRHCHNIISCQTLISEFVIECLNSNVNYEYTFKAIH